MPCVSGPGSNSLPFRERFLFGDTARAHGELGVDSAAELGLARFVLDLGIAMLACGQEALWGRRDKNSLGSGHGGGWGEEVGGAILAA